MHRILAVFLVLFVASCGGDGDGQSATLPARIEPPQPAGDGMRFSLIEGSGLRRSFGGVLTRMTIAELFGGGVAAADFDADGDVDLYVVGGPQEPNHLYANRGDGTFVEMAAQVGLAEAPWGSGPAFGDFDGDGDLDLFVGAVGGHPYHLFQNRLDEVEASFIDVTTESRLTFNSENTMGATFYDYDGDGFLDLFLGHWGAQPLPGEDTETVWRNNGDSTFTSASVETGIAAGLLESITDWSFTPNFSDIDSDGDGDLLMASDDGTSQVFVNNGDGTFTRTTDRDVIVDQAGMGAAVGDYDNDNDMDWFVTSVYDLDELGHRFGNRLYRNDGSGGFEDLTAAANVDEGGWGWGSCAADFDNDTNLDIFHVTGWLPFGDKDYRFEPVRFFHNGGFGIFAERAEELGLEDTGQGRGIACFDAERDGDIDIVITNVGPFGLVFYRNETENDNHYLSVETRGTGRNHLGIGAWITVTTEQGTQVREMGGHNNYNSHDPLEVHFGLGSATVADLLVRWPDGTQTRLDSVAADQQVVVYQQ